MYIGPFSFGYGNATMSDNEAKLTLLICKTQDDILCIVTVYTTIVQKEEACVNQLHLKYHMLTKYTDHI